MSFVVTNEADPQSYEAEEPSSTFTQPENVHNGLAGPPAETTHRLEISDDAVAQLSRCSTVGATVAARMNPFANYVNSQYAINRRMTTL